MNMNETAPKKTYYVSVQAQTVLEEQGAAAYEFEIEATEDEVTKLVELFEDQMENEHDTHERAMIPAMPYHYDKENDLYDANLKEIYRAIYEMGTPETRKHIENMGMPH